MPATTNQTGSASKVIEARLTGAGVGSRGRRQEHRGRQSELTSLIAILSGEIETANDNAAEAITTAKNALGGTPPLERSTKTCTGRIKALEEAGKAAAQQAV